MVTSDPVTDRSRRRAGKDFEMEIVFRRQREVRPDVSLILLDWSCRDSYHVLDYLARQDTARGRYEVIWIEYWDKHPPQLDAAMARARAFGCPPPIDTWVILHMPSEVYYHKHLMYNLGILLAQGRIVTIMDSDAFFKPTFISSIIAAFQQHPRLVLHHDEVRNTSQRFYPFNYPGFEEVKTEGCINWWGTATRGVLDLSDPLHLRNYGACFSARRDDLVMIGGADEHLDYLGHICGPYEMTFRLKNAHRKEIWHESEFLYHVWHPGQAGENNFGGPHDGKHMSSTALSVLDTGRIRPLVENEAIRGLRTQVPGQEDTEQLMRVLIDPQRVAQWRVDEGKTEMRRYDIGGRLIQMRELASSPRSETGGPPVPEMETASEPILRFATKLRLAPLWVRLVLWQLLGLKVDPGFPRARGGLLTRTRRLARRQRYMIRRCWHRLCMVYLRGSGEIVLYGSGAYVRVARILCRDLPMDVRGVIPETPTRRKRLGGCEVWNDGSISRYDGWVLLTSLPGRDEKYRRLGSMGVPKERIMPLK